MKIWWAVSALSLCIAGYSVALSATYSALAVFLHAIGHSAFALACSAAMSPLGMVLSAAILPAVTRGAALKWLLCSATVSVAAVLAMGYVSHYGGLLILRFMLGVSTNVMFVVGESTLMAISPAHQIGRIMAGYNGLITLGYASGPMLLVAGLDRTSALSTAAALIAAVMIPPLFQRRALSYEMVPNKVLFSRAASIQILPLALMTGAVAIFDNASLSFLPITSVDLGYGEEVGAIFAAAALFGAVASQLPIGWLADHLSKTRLLIACAMLAVICCCAVFIVTTSTFTVAALLFVAGGAAFGAHSVVLALIAERCAQGDLLAANATIAFSWGIGSMVGVPTIGAVLDRTSADTLGPALAAGFLIALLAITKPSPKIGRP